MGWCGDVVSVAKRDLAAGEMLDGEGGSTVWGKLMPAGDSLALGGLPLGLAHDVKLKTPIAMGQPVRWRDVEIDEYRRVLEWRGVERAGDVSHVVLDVVELGTQLGRRNVKAVRQ